MGTPWPAMLALQSRCSDNALLSDRTTMKLTVVRTFLAVAEARSFTSAAKTLGVPTSSVSRGVTRLEAALGTRLFERTTRKTRLTAAGRLYYEHARRALDS